MLYGVVYYVYDAVVLFSMSDEERSLRSRDQILHNSMMRTESGPSRSSDGHHDSHSERSSATVSSVLFNNSDESMDIGNTDPINTDVIQEEDIVLSKIESMQIHYNETMEDILLYAMHHTTTTSI